MRHLAERIWHVLHGCNPQKHFPYKCYTFVREKTDLSTVFDLLPRGIVTVQQNSDCVAGKIRIPAQDFLHRNSALYSWKLTD